LPVWQSLSGWYIRVFFKGEFVKSVFVGLAFVFIAQSSFAVSSQGMRLQLLDRDNKPLVGIPVTLDVSGTKGRWDTSSGFPKRGSKSVDVAQKTVTTDAQGIATIPGFSISSGNEFAIDIGQTFYCNDGDVSQLNFIGGDRGVRFGRVGGAENGWSCTFTGDDKSQVPGAQVCKSPNTTAEIVAALRSGFEKYRQLGCAPRRDF
jgi:hypothetical protein